jgi:hypothetical protein
MSITSIRSGEDSIVRAVRSASERARRLGETVPLAREPLTREDEALVYREARMHQGALAACLAGLGLWTVVLFLLGQN